MVRVGCDLCHRIVVVRAVQLIDGHSWSWIGTRGYGTVAHHGVHIILNNGRLLCDVLTFSRVERCKSETRERNKRQEEKCYLAVQKATNRKGRAEVGGEGGGPEASSTVGSHRTARRSSRMDTLTRDGHERSTGKIDTPAVPASRSTGHVIRFQSNSQPPIRTRLSSFVHQRDYHLILGQTLRSRKQTC